MIWSSSFSRSGSSGRRPAWSAALAATEPVIVVTKEAEQGLQPVVLIVPEAEV